MRQKRIEGSNPSDSARQPGNTGLSGPFCLDIHLLSRQEADVHQVSSRDRLRHGGLRGALERMHIDRPAIARSATAKARYSRIERQDDRLPLRSAAALGVRRRGVGWPEVASFFHPDQCRRTSRVAGRPRRCLAAAGSPCPPRNRGGEIEGFPAGVNKCPTPHCAK